MNPLFNTPRGTPTPAPAESRWNNNRLGHNSWGRGGQGSQAKGGGEGRAARPKGEGTLAHSPATGSLHNGYAESFSQGSVEEDISLHQHLSIPVVISHYHINPVMSPLTFLTCECSRAPSNCTLS